MRVEGCGCRVEGLPLEDLVGGEVFVEDVGLVLQGF